MYDYKKIKKTGFLCILAGSLMLAGCGGGGSGGGADGSSSSGSSSGGGSSGEPVPSTLSVYFAGYETTSVAGQLFRGNVDGSAEPVRLSNFTSPSAEVLSFAVSPDNNNVAYIAMADSGLPEMFLVPTAGGTPVSVGAIGTSASDIVQSFAWSPDSSYLAYVTKPTGDTQFKVYTCLADGSAPMEISGAMSNPNGNTITLSWAPDSSRVAYLADAEFDSRNELYTAPARGGSFAKVNATIISGTVQQNFSWSPDSSRIAYLQTVSSTRQLFSGAADGSGQLAMNGTLVMNGAVSDFGWAPNGSRIAYLADQDTNDVFELYTTLANGTGNIKVNPTLPTGSDVKTGSMAWASDSSRIAYTADQNTDEIYELFTVAPDGTDNRRVSAVLGTSNGDVSTFVWAPDASRLAYIAYQSAGLDNELHIVAADGSGHSKLTGGQDLQLSITWSPDSSKIAYSAQTPPGSQFDIFTITMSGSSTQVGTNLPLALSTQPGFMWTSDSNWVIHLANQTSTLSLTDKLRSSTADGGFSTIVSGTTITTSGHISSYAAE